MNVDAQPPPWQQVVDKRVFNLLGFYLHTQRFLDIFFKKIRMKTKLKKCLLNRSNIKVIISKPMNKCLFFNFTAK